ncbi:MAG: glycosyltransferase family 2 protein [Hungatella sp.]
MIDNMTTMIRNLVVFLDSMIEETIELEQHFREQDFGACQIHLNGLFQALETLDGLTDQLTEKETKGSYGAMISNVMFTLEKVVEQINLERDKRVLILLRYQLLPFLQELREDTYFWYGIYPDAKRMAVYYEEEFAKNHENQYVKAGTFQYQVSIFIPVYNKVAYTQKCIESIYQNTDFEANSCELILINDGSTDESQAYFESLGVQKVVELHDNVRTMIFSLACRVCEGRYMVFVNNDTIVTPGWLETLLACVKSDPKIISATPTTPNTSNFQNIFVQDMTEKDVASFSAHYNQQNPQKWEERSRIMPVIALYDAQKVNQIGFADRFFDTMEYWDDDFSLRARRAGFKQMLCQDVCCYHFGSVTGKENQRQAQICEEGSKLFLQKHGVEPWGRGHCYDIGVMHTLPHMTFAAKNKVSILGLDDGFGDTVLQLKNQLKERRIAAVLYQVTTEAEYAPDLCAQADCFWKIQEMEELTECLGDLAFDIVYLSKPLEQYAEYKKLLEFLIPHMTKGGYLLAKISNFYYYKTMEQVLGGSLLEDHETTTWLNPVKLEGYLRAKFRHITAVEWKNPVIVPNSQLSDLYAEAPKLSLIGDLEKIIYSCEGPV